MYAAKGSYMVTLSVTDASGQSSQVRQTVNIKKL
jgi:PKD repeat protein